jgi:hypothetical protein
VKLRLQFNSIRFRLKRSEVEQFVRNGRVEEKIIVGSREDGVFQYVLESTESVSSLKATVTPGGIIVQVPLEEATRWVFSDQISIEGQQPIDNQKSLRILIEKDFACLDGTEEQNADTFPNPLAGLKC